MGAGGAPASPRRPASSVASGDGERDLLDDGGPLRRGLKRSLGQDHSQYGQHGRGAKKPSPLAGVWVFGAVNLWVTLTNL